MDTHGRNLRLVYPVVNRCSDGRDLVRGIKEEEYLGSAVRRA